MWNPYSPFIQTERQSSLFNITKELSNKVGKRATLTDHYGKFLDDNLRDLKDYNYQSLSLPKALGGENLSLYEFVLLQEKLAEGDASVALSIGWHLGIVMELRDEGLWDEETFNWIGKEIHHNKKIINRAATEPATGSPTRGGIPETTAVRDKTGYILNGRKTFTTMANVLDYYIVSAKMNDLNEVGWFLVENGQNGVKIEETWDSLGMRGTASDDLILSDVHVPHNRLVEHKTPPRKGKVPKGWLLHIPACYLGIAIAARNEAVEFAKNYQPNSLNTTISEVAHIKEKIGKMDLAILNAQYFLFGVADKWDNNPENRTDLGPDLAAVKTIATNNANEVVDLAMRIVGGRSLAKSSNLERHYRDVRAGLHNPPMDDSVLHTLASRAIND
ncbi:acyl-CoA dehydrogenase family protein [Pseudalkalibacillus berkeleyi]|uniref:Acyl-CoA/acyl-ACP dehydrogenase n=1 Tax=Pseudalkalibacillus berkeleyi TaxID=1069813 RepID=A0ABS9H0T5_9BACL|nr:acyl-CoA dehydrogenase family protein [Pseudalkalibacillus berkeleyi]MCF6137407.1 acyl-CoA/acyl-ACP dehydrogenase [Pseudalkalibacillus berkeleyi]